MANTFRLLAAMLIVAMLGSIGVGFWSFSLPRPDEFWAEVSIAHYVLGLITVFGILGVHCLVFIYFLGTGRWVKEVTLAYRMPDAPKR